MRYPQLLEIDSPLLMLLYHMPVIITHKIRKFIGKIQWTFCFQPAGCRNYQFSQFLQEGYGYKALTTEDKAKMFGLNMANLLGIEPKKITKTPPKK